MSKLNNILANTKRSSAYARFLPKQFLGPKEKGCTIARLSLANFGGGVESQRSGTNDAGSAKLRAERLAMYWLTDMEA
jgi:hypothetical protein